MSRFPLTPEQQDEAQRIERILMESVRNEIRSIAELLASKPDRQLLGQTEFEVRAWNELTVIACRHCP